MEESDVRNLSDSMPPTYALILVGVIPTPKDLEIARLLGWYRIPFRFAPKVVQMDFLAFYQPSSFGKGLEGRIEYFTDVRGVELTTRGELIKEEPDHPRAHEEYFKIQVGPLIRLQTPILAKKWKRITFLYTTGDLFSKAKIINDLVVKTEERKILWNSLREKANQSQEYHQEVLPDFELDPVIMMMLGDLHLLSDDSSWYESI
ncbi:MAG: hypothetical protein FJZ98_07850 [Chloroflexi bacterium]|nr:hypothetical protein [Chloroflexota bacterium]